MTLSDAHDHIDRIRPPRTLRSMMMIEVSYLHDRINALEQMIKELEWEQANDNQTS